MRVLVVSAHFPPNFVSGGTLVPFRSALELARRGHDVRVFAGWIGPTHGSGDAFDDVAVGPSGEERSAAVPVRWFTTNDAIGWDRRSNFDNPAARAEFAGTLRAFEPDIVHFHSMQGLGAGLLTEADRSGVPFVVTAHDFWWWCGRQFLCDRDYHPCCPVVVAGVCSCAVDRAWLDERTRWTTPALRLAARVLAVSKSSAAVLRANGVPPDQLEVVDNPVEGVGAGAETSQLAETPARRDATDRHGDVRYGDVRHGDVRFLFAGGTDPMKGLPVLRLALRSLGATTGWTADLYGVDGPSAAGGGDPLPPGVRTHPAFVPDELRAVLSNADVLVIPSVMQETYSILTREALAMGVAVLTTTCLGPEEVVTDRVNGLVVPQDDPGALAAAMRELVEDRPLLEQLRRGAHGVELTTVEVHCDRLEAVYAAALETRPDALAPNRRANETGGGGREDPEPRAPRAPRAPGRIVERVLFVVGIDGAPLRYRAHLPAEALGLLGVHADVRHYRHPDILELAEAADVVVVYRVPATTQVRRFVEDAHRRGTPVLFDVDDLIFDPGLEPEIPALQVLAGAERDLWLQGVHRYRTTMELCDGFIGSTQRLCEHASAVTGLPSFRFPNGVGLVMSRLADTALEHDPAPGPVRVGYLSGTDTHDQDWAMVEDAVVTVLDQVGDAELWLVGKLTPGAAAHRLGDRLVQVPFQPWTALPKLLHTLDVNLAPLEPTSRFNDAKSAIKWLEAGLSATPTIASPTRPFQEVIDHGVNGMLAGDPEEWARALTTLLGDGALRRRLGHRARRDALLDFGPWTQGRRYLEILRSAELRGPHTRTWQPVLLDEPFEAITLDPYGEPEPGHPPALDPGTRTRLGTLARRGVGAVRRHGFVKTSALLVDRVRRRSCQG
ncbi:MAG: glycosyltransferase [Actinomycetota bacterium]|nr:glycosyltransferase [Actinomycetota bacterium]